MRNDSPLSNHGRASIQEPRRVRRVRAPNFLPPTKKSAFFCSFGSGSAFAGRRAARTAHGHAPAAGTHATHRPRVCVRGEHLSSLIKVCPRFISCGACAVQGMSISF